MTPAGLDLLRVATRTHIGGVRRYFSNVIAAPDQEVITASLDRVNAALGNAEPLASATCAQPSA